MIVPLDPPDDDPPDEEPPDEEAVGVPDDPPDELVFDPSGAGARFWTVHATMRDERAKNETRGRIMRHGRSTPRAEAFAWKSRENAMQARVTDDAITPPASVGRASSTTREALSR
jgi:hypothetical protein